jgi:hypothetical protein
MASDYKSTGCHLTAAKLLDKYYQQRQDIRPSQRAIIAFHAWQSYAFAASLRTSMQAMGMRTREELRKV